jgi:hypothetical protein
MCMVAPTSIAAAFGWSTDIVFDSFRPITNPPAGGAEGWAALMINFLNGIARDRLTASPLSRAQQPMDHVFLRGNLPPKSRRPLPSITRIDLSRFYAHRRTLSEMVFLKLMPSCSKKCQTA